MSESQDRRVWFPAKRYGYGWGWPCRWQGWLVLVGYLILVFGGIFFIEPSSHPGWYMGYVTGLSVLLCVVCRIKGEDPAWRWGKKEEDPRE